MANASADLVNSLQATLGKMEVALGSVGEAIAHLQQEIMERHQWEARYRTISELTSDYVYSANIAQDGQITTEWVTGAFQRITGYSPEDLVNVGGWVAVIHPDDLPLAQEFGQRIATNQQGILEYRIVTRQGEIRWLRDYARPEWDDTEQRVVRVLGAVQNITQQRQAETALKESEERFRQLSEATFEGVLIHDQGIILAVNQALADLSGYEPSELLGMNSLQLVAEAWQDFVLNKMRLEEDQPYEILGRKKDGSTFLVEVNGKACCYKGRRVRMVAIRDITERQQAEAALRESEERFRTQYKGIPIPTYTWKRIGEDFILVDYNDAAAAITRGQIVEFIGKSACEMYAQVPEVREAIAKCFIDKTTIKQEMPYQLMSTGESKYLAVSYVFVPPDLVMVHTEDITERKQAEAALYKSEADNRALLNAIPDLFLRISKDGIYLDCKPPKGFHMAASGINLIGKSEFEILPAAVAQQRQYYTQQALETGEIQVCEYQLQVNGETRDEEARIVVSGEDEVLVMVRDITERRRAEAALQQAKDQLQAVLDAVPGTVAWISADLKYLGVNSYLAATFGLQPQAFVGKEVNFFTSSPELTEFTRQFFASSARETSLEVDWDVDGSPLSYLTVAQKYLQGQAAVFVGIDITRRKQAEEALHQAKAELEVKVEERTSELRQANDQLRSEIIERRRAEAALATANLELQKSEERFRTLLSNIPGAIYRCADDADWTMEFLSEPIQAICGYPASDFLQDGVRTYASIIHSEDYPTVKHLVATAIAQKTPYIIEYRIFHADGEIRWAYEKGQGIFAENGQLLWLDGAIFDITERKRAEEKLRNSEQKYRNLVETSSDLIWSVDASGRWTFVNQAAKKIYGYEPEAMLGRSFVDFLTPEQAQKDLKVFDRILTGEDHFQYETVHLRRDGVPVNLSFNAIALRDEQGNITGTTGTAVDISERKRVEQELGQYREHLEELVAERTAELTQINVQLQQEIIDRRQIQLALEQAKQAAEAANQAKGEFLAMMSHEIRTPMNGIIGMSRLLLNTELSREQQNFAQTILSSNNALLTILNDILDLAKIESGKLELEQQPFSLQTAVEESLNLLTPKAIEKGLQLTAWIEPQLPQLIVGDAARLRQILVNLLSNAVKFTEAGKVSVAVSSECLVLGSELEDPMHTPLLSPTSEQKTTSNSNLRTQNSPSFYKIQFAIKDTGIGIPSERMNRLFQTFSQIDSSISRRYGGTGLGLAICKQLVEMMGGNIWVESQVDQGSIFYFTLVAQSSLTQPELPETAAIQAIPRIAEQIPLRILLAEDNEVNQQVALLTLAQLGYQADVVSNGLAVLQALHHQSYDVVLMDIQMPEMDGLTATQQICQQWPEGQRPRIIAMTAYTAPGDRQRCLEAGMAGYISKPIRVTELIHALSPDQPPPYSPTELISSETSNLNQTLQLNPIFSPLDAKVLQAIRTMAGTKADEILAQIIDNYFEDAPQLLQAISNAIAIGDSAALYQAAHTLRSASANLGATTFAQLCKELEAMGRAGTTAEAATKMPQLEAAYETVKAALQLERQPTEG